MEALAEIASVAWQLREVADHLPALVTAARADGLTWAQVGAAHAICRQGAQQRYGQGQAAGSSWAERAGARGAGSARTGAPARRPCAVPCCASGINTGAPAWLPGPPPQAGTGATSRPGGAGLRRPER